MTATRCPSTSTAGRRTPTRSTSGWWPAARPRCSTWAAGRAGWSRPDRARSGRAGRGHLRGRGRDQPGRRRAGAAPPVDQRLPAEGRWGTALLMDGNIGIGGDVPLLLGRCRTLVVPGGLVICEVDRDPDRHEVRERDPAHGNAASRPLPWARIGAAAWRSVAAAPGPDRRGGVVRRWAVLRVPAVTPMTRRLWIGAAVVIISNALMIIFMTFGTVGRFLLVACGDLRRGRLVVCRSDAAAAAADHDRDHHGRGPAARAVRATR